VILETGRLGGYRYFGLRRLPRLLTVRSVIDQYLESRTGDIGNVFGQNLAGDGEMFL
jgi:hypothetical protein